MKIPSEQLVAWRKYLNWSQAEFSQISKIPQQIIEDIEQSNEEPVSSSQFRRNRAARWFSEYVRFLVLTHIVALLLKDKTEGRGHVKDASL